MHHSLPAGPRESLHRQPLLVVVGLEVRRLLAGSICGGGGIGGETLHAGHRPAAVVIHQLVHVR